tara:strand:+ start:3234 stop:4043 length:810 start_codon:yes stop_codon:yes gene_type:complete
MIVYLKHQLVKVIEKIPLLQIFIYNNLEIFDFLLPHDKDYYALKLLFSVNERRSFLDIGGNIGLSSIGFRKLGYKNTIHIFEPDKKLVSRNLLKIKKKYKNIKIHSVGLSNKNSFQNLYKAYYKNIYFHFNNSFDQKYIKQKLYENYGDKSKKFLIKSKKLSLKKFDNMKINDRVCFIKIDVEGLDHKVLYGMKNCIKKFLPVILVEYNYSNFSKIQNFLKKKYDCYFYDFQNNKLKKLSVHLIQKLKNGKILENIFKKNSVNLFFIRR